MLKVRNRSANKPIAKLPASIQFNDKTTVGDVKKHLAKEIGLGDPHRLGIFESEKKKMLKDNKALVFQYEEVLSTKEILVQDLGPQVSWRTVYIIEYAGPILIHLLFPLLLRPYLYSNPPPLSISQILSCCLLELHFLKREYETIFLHKFSLASMPMRFIPKNCGHYWGLSGVVLAYFIYGPAIPYLTYTASSSTIINVVNIIGIGLFIFGQVSNYMTHVTLSNLRSPGGTERGIPQGYGFGVVTCPNYMFEIVAWVGMLLVTKSVATVVFLAVGITQMHLWAKKKERAYRTEFGDQYEWKEYGLIPGLL